MWNKSKSNIPIIIAITDRNTGSFTRCVSLFFMERTIAIMPNTNAGMLNSTPDQPAIKASAEKIIAALLNFLSIIINPFPKVHTLYLYFRHNILQIYNPFRLC